MADLDKELDRAARAQGILKDPIVEDAFEELEKIYTQAWRESPARDEEGREKIYHMMQALIALRQHFESVVMTGELAKTKIEDLRTGKHLM